MKPLECNESPSYYCRGVHTVLVLRMLTYLAHSYLTYTLRMSYKRARRVESDEIELASAVRWDE